MLAMGIGHVALWGGRFYTPTGAGMTGLSGARSALFINLSLLAAVSFILSKSHPDIGRLEFRAADLRRVCGLLSPCVLIVPWLLFNTERFGSPLHPSLLTLSASKLLLPEFHRSLVWGLEITSTMLPGREPSFMDVILGIPKFFISCLTGCLLLTFGWLGLAELIVEVRKGRAEPALALYLFLTELAVWLWETLGRLYMVRHLLHPSCTIAIIAAYGAVWALRRAGVKEVEEPLAFLSALLFGITQWIYVSSAFDARYFTIYRLALPRVPNASLLAATLAAPFMAMNIAMRKPEARKAFSAVAASLVVMAVAAPIVNAISVVGGAYGGDIEAFWWDAIPESEKDLITFYREHGIKDITVTLGVFYLAYYVNVPVARLDHWSGLTALKDVLTSEDRAYIYARLRELGVRYFILPNERSQYYQWVELFNGTTLFQMINEGDHFALVEEFAYYRMYEVV